jgi:hypothetical protein
MIITLLILAAAPTATVPVAAKPDRVICRFEQQLTSRIPLRVCRTTAQWAQVERETQADLREAAKKRNSGDRTAN